MAVWARCGPVLGFLRQVDPIIVLEELGSALFDTALLLVVRDRCSDASEPGRSPEESRQRAISNFFMTYNLIIRLVPILPALLLARIGDSGRRKAPIVVPLGGYVVCRVALLLVLIFRLPLEVMFGSAVLFGLSGGYCAFWPGVMTLVSLGSAAKDRSKVMMRVELLYGAAGVVGSLVSGHLFQVRSATLGQGVVLLIVSTLLNVLIFIHSIFLLQVKEVSSSSGGGGESAENGHLLASSDSDASAAAPVRINRTNVVLLFAAAFLYDFAVGGAVEVLGVFVIKEPLSWNAAQVGYGNAAGCTIFLTSFLGVVAFRRCLSDVSLILLGMVSFASGIFFMSFVTATYMFYLARTLTLFALIPLPTIRALLSQQVPQSSCGRILTGLQLTLKLAGLLYIPAYTRIYQRSLGWFPGLVFTLSSVLTVLAMLPVSVVGCRRPPQQSMSYRRIQGD